MRWLVDAGSAEIKSENVLLAVRADSSLKVGARLSLRVSSFRARVLCPTGRGGGKSLVLEHKRGCKKIAHLALKHAMGN